MNVRPKKYLGQHFLEDTKIARQIVESLHFDATYQSIVEVGPGKGILTSLLIEKETHPLYLVEIDPALVTYLKDKYATLTTHIIEADFLKFSLDKLGNNGPMAIIGNFPYNITSQIFFKILQHRHSVQEVVGMMQKEVGERISASPGCKAYGILSVLLQAFYDITYLFTVPPHVFTPLPKVQSAVIRLRKNKVQHLPCDEGFFFQLVKAGFQNRRKTLRNAFKCLGFSKEKMATPIFDKRAEALTVADFVGLAQVLDQKREAEKIMNL